MKKLITIWLLALVLSACGTESNPLVGTWEGDIVQDGILVFNADGTGRAWDTPILWEIVRGDTEDDGGTIYITYVDNPNTDPRQRPQLGKIIELTENRLVLWPGGEASLHTYKRK